MEGGGSLLPYGTFDDLLHMGYAEPSGKTKIIDKEKLFAEGIDSSIPDALAITFFTDEDSEEEYIEPAYRLRYPSIGI